MSGSWRQPRQILMAALGLLTVFYLLAPTLVIVPMSFTRRGSSASRRKGSPSSGIERMFTDRQWSSGIVNSAIVAVLTAILGHRPRDARRARPEPWPLPGRSGDERARARAADRPGRDHRDRDVLAVRPVADQRIARRGWSSPTPRWRCRSSSSAFPPACGRWTGTSSWRPQALGANPGGPSCGSRCRSSFRASWRGRSSPSSRRGTRSSSRSS